MALYEPCEIHLSVKPQRPLVHEGRYILKGTMLKLTGRWWSRNRLWYYTDEPGKKTADRPHSVAVLLALMSPLLAIVAAIISIQSLRTSEQSLQVGQQAYINLSDGVMDFTRVVSSRDDNGASDEDDNASGDNKNAKDNKGDKDEDDDESDNKDIEGISIRLQGTFHNVGHTPAHFQKVEIRFVLPAEWSVSSEPFHLSPDKPLAKRPNNEYEFVRLLNREELPVDLPSNDSSHWTCFNYVILSGLAAKRFDNYLLTTAPVTKFLSTELRVVATYQDVFGKSHTVSWTWTTDYRSPYPKDITNLMEN